MPKLINELAVMNTIADIMRPLGKGEQRRIVNWLEDYFDIYEDTLVAMDDVIDTVTYAEEPIVDAEESYDEPAPAEPEPQALDTFEAFYAAVAPKTAIQKIATAAYWLENKEGSESWKSFEVNKLLKGLGVKLSSVSGTLAIDAKKEAPLTVVLQKSGDSMQSRKTFALSADGQQFVEDRIG